MASEEHVDLSVQLPPELGEWLHDQASEQGVPPEALLEQLLSAYRTVSAANEGEAYDLSTLLEDRDGELDERLETQREEYTELIQDVRERVIQVKHETDGKAAADHAHDELRARLDELAETVEGLDGVRGDLDDLDGAVEELSAELDAGFDNYETVLRYLSDTSDDLETKLTKLARLTVDLREEVLRLAAAEARRSSVDTLRLAANREGIERAKCEECSSTVRIGLLTEAACPHCASTFTDVQASDSFGPFGSNRLLTGDAPALPESAEPDLDEELDETFFEDDDRSAPDIEERE
jgi:predicted transcriptional regulator